MVAASLLPLLLFAVRAAVGSAAGAVGVSGGGQLWCVAKNNAEDGALQSAIDWACVPNGGADCRAIQQGGACYEPPDLLAHASYAFNDYFLRSGVAASPAAFNDYFLRSGVAASPAACDFSGAASISSTGAADTNRVAFCFCSPSPVPLPLPSSSNSPDRSNPGENEMRSNAFRLDRRRELSPSSLPSSSED